MYLEAIIKFGGWTKLEIETAATVVTIGTILLLPVMLFLPFFMG